jgi:hypothetical protein
MDTAADLHWYWSVGVKHRLIDIGICKLFGQAMVDGHVHAVTTALR